MRVTVMLCYGFASPYRFVFLFHYSGHVSSSLLGLLLGVTVRARSIDWQIRTDLSDADADAMCPWPMMFEWVFFIGFVIRLCALPCRWSYWKRYQYRRSIFWFIFVKGLTRTFYSTVIAWVITVWALLFCSVLFCSVGEPSRRIVQWGAVIACYYRGLFF